MLAGDCGGSRFLGGSATAEGGRAGVISKRRHALGESGILRV